MTDAEIEQAIALAVELERVKFRQIVEDVTETFGRMNECAFVQGAETALDEIRERIDEDWEIHESTEPGVPK